ncbi:MAG: ATP-binding protein [Candidatus Nomurabacteria bacterium]|nr:ATP-binding protein [Candidatus Nomurabacteria bacterium]
MSFLNKKDNTFLSTPITSMRCRLLKVLSYIAIVVLFVFGFLNIFPQNNFFVGFVQLVIGVFLMLNVLFLKKFNNFKLASLVFIFTLFFIMIFLFCTGGYQDTGIYWFCLFPLIVYFLRGRKYGLYFSILFILTILFIYIFKGSFVPYNFIQIRQVLSSFITISLITHFYLSIEEKDSESLEENENKLKSINQKLQDEIQNSDLIKKELSENILDSENTKKAVLNILEDVQDEKIKVEKISQKLTLATKSAKIGVWEWDIVKNKLSWDNIMCVLYGIKPEDFRGIYETWLEKLHPDDKKHANEEMQTTLSGGKDFDTVFRVIWPNQEIHYIKAYASLESDINGKPIKMVGINFDVSHDKEVDIEKTEFVSLASHQLKTPVGALNWNLELLLGGDYGKITEKQREIISDMYKMNQRMNDLINSLLNVSRIDLGVFIIEPVPTNWVDMCDEVLAELDSKIKIKNHIITKKYIGDLATIPADPKLLRIIFQNYISNAVKYTHGSGVINIIVENKNDEVLISVSNNGDSIPEKEKSRIFSKLFRASNAQEQDPDGNGLGLYIVKKIAENGGGRVWFESREGKDTVFYASFPVSGMIKREGEKVLV